MIIAKIQNGKKQKRRGSKPPVHPRLSCYEFAKMIGREHSHVYRVVKGERKSPAILARWNALVAKLEQEASK